MKYDKLVEHYFFEAAHIGSLGPTQKNRAHVRTGSPSQGEFFDLYAQWDEKGQIQKACFKAQGNPYLIAGLEWGCCQLEGSLITSLSLWDFQTLCQKFNVPHRYYPTAIQLEKGYNEMVKLLKENFYE